MGKPWAPLQNNINRDANYQMWHDNPLWGEMSKRGQPIQDP